MEAVGEEREEALSSPVEAEIFRIALACVVV
jgi:hypothetical protein